MKLRKVLVIMPAKPRKVVNVIVYITFGWCCQLLHHHDLEAA